MSFGRCTCQIGLHTGEMLILFVWQFGVDAFNITISFWKRNQVSRQLNQFSLLIHK